MITTTTVFRPGTSVYTSYFYLFILDLYFRDQGWDCLLVNEWDGNSLFSVQIFIVIIFVFNYTVFSWFLLRYFLTSPSEGVDPLVFSEGSLPDELSRWVSRNLLVFLSRTISSVSLTVLFPPLCTPHLFRVISGVGQDFWPPYFAISFSIQGRLSYLVYFRGRDLDP